VGSRGHHADIGGVTPGSMPPFSTRIEEEGVQIDNVKLVDRGLLREAEMPALLSSRAHPPRNPHHHQADPTAHAAPNAKSLRNQGDGKVQVTDGPYLETKEHIGGFWVLECASMDEAVEWGRKAVIACRAPVEVRQFH